MLAEAIYEIIDVFKELEVPCNDSIVCLLNNVPYILQNGIKDREDAIRTGMKLLVVIRAAFKMNVMHSSCGKLAKTSM